jgi:hypothetical protein
MCTAYPYAGPYGSQGVLITVSLWDASIEGSLERRRRRGQDEINVLVREFSESVLSQKEFALKVEVHPLTVARWVESCSVKPLTDGPTSTSSVSSFVVPTATEPTAVFTENGLNILDKLVKPKRIDTSQPRRLSNYIRKVAKLGGYLARASDPPPGNLVIWRGFSRLNNIHLGMLPAIGNVGN